MRAMTAVKVVDTVADTMEITEPITPPSPLMSQSEMTEMVSFQSMEPSARNRPEKAASCSWVRLSPMSRPSW